VVLINRKTQTNLQSYAQYPSINHPIDQILESTMPRSIQIHFDFYLFHLFISHQGIKALERSKNQTNGYCFTPHGLILSKSQVDGSIVIRSTFEGEILWHSRPISRFAWATYRLSCQYETQIEVLLMANAIALIGILCVPFLLKQLIALTLQN